MREILTLNKIAACGTEKFDKSAYTVSDSAAHPSAIMVRSASLHECEFGEELLAIGRAGAGTNNIPVDRCAEKGIVVFNTPGANANAVKELVIAGLFLSSRKILDGATWAKTLTDTPELNVPKQVEKGKSRFAGPEIAGKTLGIIGLGAIGRKVASAASALGMKVIGTDPFLSDKDKSELSDICQIVDTREEIYPVADYLTLHVPCNAETKGFLNSGVFAQMKDGARILNFARGELVNDDDLEKALSSGKLSAYVTDFPNAKTAAMNGVIPIPHLGASTPESEDNCAMMAADELIDYLENGNIRNSVNYPSVSCPEGGRKVCVLFKEGADMTGAAALGLKGGYGYAIFTGNADEQILSEKAGVLRVRVID